MERYLPFKILYISGHFAIKIFFFLLMKLLLFLVASRMDSNTSICWLNFIALTTFLFWLNLGV